jgi:predicted DNA-binding transcriptional regulator AlpA
MMENQKVLVTSDLDRQMPDRGGADAIQVGNYIGVSPSGVYRLEELDPTFPKSKKILRSRRWDSEAVIQWFKGK